MIVGCQGRRTYVRCACTNAIVVGARLTFTTWCQLCWLPAVISIWMPTIKAVIDTSLHPNPLQIFPFAVKDLTIHVAFRTRNLHSEKFVFHFSADASHHLLPVLHIPLLLFPGFTASSKVSASSISFFSPHQKQVGIRTLRGKPIPPKTCVSTLQFVILGHRTLCPSSQPLSPASKRACSFFRCFFFKVDFSGLPRLFLWSFTHFLQC